MGTLFVVATPIGNLEDITLRALRVLRDVAVVAAEDTRRTGNLLRHYAIHTPLVSLHEHNEHDRAEQLIARLRAGESVALVSDAGTPGISDPGAALVSAVRAAGGRVDPIPGPSAVSAALSASGLPFTRFAFAGFPPTKPRERRDWFRWVAALPDVPVVGFEAPHRIASTLAECGTELVDRPIILARELTKAHEEWTFISPSDSQAEHVVERGEFVFVICPIKVAVSTTTPLSDERIVEEFGRLTSSGRFVSRRATLHALSEQLGTPPKALYAALERVKKLSQT